LDFALEDGLEEEFQDLFERKHDEQERRHRDEAGEREVDRRSRVHWERVHLVDELKAVPEVGKRLDVRCSKKRFRVFALNPLVMEL
jgi:hypothetical protein